MRTARLAALSLLGALAMGAAACGLAPGGTGDAAPSGSRSPAPSPSPSPASPAPGSPAPSSPSGPVLGSANNAAGWTAVVTAGPDGQLEETLTVIGPLAVFGGCVSTLTAWAETPAGVTVPTPTPSPAAHCLAIALVVIPAGSTRAFTAVLPDPGQPGAYAIHATLDTQGSGSPVPVVTVST
ncbi:MAG: hypothetical protein ABSB36_08805 [Candidatus Dormibacteria bacterium]